MDKELAKRALQISYDHKLSHLGSVLTTLPIVDEIYKGYEIGNKVVLSNGHAGLAQYVALEHYFGIDAEETLVKHGIHPVRDPERMLDVSTGSLGQGITVACGLALADRTRPVDCVISDGELAEGACWESLFFAQRQKLDNLRIHVNWNGFGAYRETDNMTHNLVGLFPNVKVWHTAQYIPDVEFMKGLKAHYHVMSEQDYQTMLEHYE